MSDEPVKNRALRGKRRDIAATTPVLVATVIFLRCFTTPLLAIVDGIASVIIIAAMCIAMRPNVRRFIIVVLCVIVTGFGAVTAWKSWEADAPARALYAQQEVERNEKDARRQKVVDEATASLKGQSYVVYHVKLDDPDWKTGKATLTVEIGGRSAYGQVAIRLTDGIWVPGCPTIGGGMISLAADNNRLGLHFYGVGNCPAGLVDPTPAVP